MTEKDDAPYTPCRLIGYVKTDIEAPLFVIPVFKDLDTDAHVVQIGDTDDNICKFENIPGAIIASSIHQHVIKKLGEPMLFGLQRVGGQVIFLEKKEFVNFLRAALERSEFEAVPAFALSVARFVDDKDQKQRLKKKIFNDTPKSLIKTRKYFLENNVMKESLLDNLPVSYHDIVINTRFDVIGGQINVILPEGTSEEFKQTLAADVTKTFREFSEESFVNINFEDNINTPILTEIVDVIKQGYFDFDENILDLPYVKGNFSPREALIVVPEAAYHYMNSYQNKTSTLYSLFDNKYYKHTISNSTARKILGLESVTLISAMLFRFRVFGHTSDVFADRRMKLHVACFSIDFEALSRYPEAAERLRKVFSPRFAEEYRHIIKSTLFTYSMILFMTETGVLNLASIEEIVRFSRDGFCIESRFDTAFLRRWANFCATSKNFESQMLLDRLSIHNSFAF